MKKFNGKLITEYFFPNLADSPEQINFGDCYIWAYIAYKLFPGTELWSNPEHAFIKYNGKYYDSESPNGVYDYKNLKCFKRCETKKAERQSLFMFINDWGFSSYIRAECDRKIKLLKEYKD